MCVFYVVVVACFLPHSMWGLSFPGQGLNLHPPAWEAWSLNWWTVRESPKSYVFLIKFLVH